MQMIRIMAASLVLAASAAIGAVDYVLDGVNDKVDASAITWPGLLPDYFILGTAGNRGVYRHFPTTVQGYLVGSFVSKPHPDWAGTAVSNLYMGDLNIYNVSNLTFRSLITYDGGSSLNFFTNCVASLGVNVDGIRVQHGYANSTTFLGYNSQSTQMVHYGFGNLLGGHVNRVHQMVGATSVVAYGTVSWTGGGIGGLQVNRGRANVNWAGFLTYSTQTVSTLGSGNLNWCGEMSAGGYQTMLPGSQCSWNVGGNNVNSNAYSYLFGLNMVSHLGNELVAPSYWIDSVPSHRMHAVPMWWVSNEICQATSHFATVIFPGLAASASETRAGLLHTKFVAPDSLTNVVQAQDGDYAAGGLGYGGNIDLSGGDAIIAVPGYGGNGGHIIMIGGSGDNIGDTHYGGNSGNINLSGGDTRFVGGNYAADGGSIMLQARGVNGGGNIVSTGGVNGFGGNLYMDDGGGSIDTKSGSIQLGRTGSRITLSKGTHANISVTLPTEAGKIALVSDVVSNQEARSATPMEVRMVPPILTGGPLSNKYVSPYSLTNIIRSYGAGGNNCGVGGSIDLSGGTNLVNIPSATPGRGGSINLRGGGADLTVVGSQVSGRGGSIDLSGANASGINSGSSGGSISSKGYTGLGSSVNGGSLTMDAGSAGPGGSINTANGGGILNTAAGIGSSSPFLSIGPSTQPSDSNGGQYRMQFHRLGIGNVYFQTPDPNLGGSTCMYTVAQSPLNMAMKNIVNVMYAANPFDAPNLLQVQTLVNNNLFIGATPAEVRTGTAGAPKGVTPLSLASTGTGSTYPILTCNNGTTVGASTGGDGGSIKIQGGNAGTGPGGVGGRGGMFTAYGGPGGNDTSTAGSGGAGGVAGTITANGGAGGSTAGSAQNGGLGGSGGTVLMNGGTGADGTATTVGGAGGNGGYITMVGGNGSSSGASPYAGGGAGTINLSGGNASSTSSGGQGGSFVATANGPNAAGYVSMSASSVAIAGFLNTCGGYGDASSYGGEIDTHGGNSAGAYGGYIYTFGSQYHGGFVDTRGISAVGGDINTKGTGSAAGGSINTSGGGGNVDTTTGYIGLGPAASRTTISRQGVAPAGSGSTLYVPGSMVGNNGTVMTTVATSTLNMNNNKICNLPDLNMFGGSPDANLQQFAVNYNQITNLLYLMSLQTTPIGSIQAFGGDVTTSPDGWPDGWLVCDGTAYSRDVANPYRKLYLAIGTAWGVGDGSTTFNVPDLRGYFTRGAGASAVDPYTPQPRTVGSVQTEQAQLASHNHTYAAGYTSTDPANPQLSITSDANAQGYTIGYKRNASVATITADQYCDFSQTWTYRASGLYDAYKINIPMRLIAAAGNSNETRPDNKAVNYIIRYK